MKIQLYHKIGEGGEDSATVRQFLVANSLTEFIEFYNLTYDGPRQAVHELLGVEEAPLLVVDGKPVRGKVAILDWLRTNLMRMRD